MYRILSSCLGVTILISSVSLAAAADKKSAPNEKLKALLKERVETTQKILELKFEMYKLGQARYSEIRAAQATFLGARLDLCETKADRLKVLEDMVKLAKESEELTAAQLKAGLRGTVVDTLYAKDYRLECEIALERAKAEK